VHKFRRESGIRRKGKRTDQSRSTVIRIPLYNADTGVSLLHGFRYDVTVAGRELPERSKQLVSQIHAASGHRGSDHLDRSARITRPVWAEDPAYTRFCDGELQ